MEIGPAAESGCGVAGEEKIAGLGWQGVLGPGPDASGGSSGLEPERNCIRLRWVG